MWPVEAAPRLVVSLFPRVEELPVDRQVPGPRPGGRDDARRVNVALALLESLVVEVVGMDLSWLMFVG
jgi:hypothetical protein